MRPFELNTGKILHRDPALSIVIEKRGANHYFAVIPVRASTPTIVNVAISNDNWIPIATGLTGVLSWRLSEQKGGNFRYAFVSSPSAFATAFGWVSEATAITQIYAKRVRTITLNMELVTWTA